MGRKYRTKVPRKRLRKLNRSNAGPVFALIGIIMGILAVAALIVFVVLPFLLPDAIKLALATLLRARLYRRIPA